MPDLLIELFSEELPAGMQAKAADDFKKLMTNGMVDAGLTYAAAASFATPRRLALTVEGLLDASPTTVEERKGPKTSAPEKALEGFLRGAGVTKDDLEVRQVKKDEVYFAQITKAGRKAEDIIAEVLEHTIRNFPWPKSMRWGTGSLRWVRPLQSILCILTDEEGARVVPVTVDQFTASNTTEGHRFMAPGRFAVRGFDDYEAKLKRAHVMLRADERADAIWQDATNQAFAQGLEVVEDKGLLAEVSGLVECPVVLMGAIDDEFLELPAEVLKTSMKEHQKFFSVADKDGRIVKFVTVANRETADQGATILAGNQKVLSARLADAKFFWENDLRTAKADMSVWTDALSNVTFHNKLGSQAERIDRIAALARELAPIVGADADMVETAARVAKADLSSEMVYEFPELQGLMGRYYAQAAGMDPAIANACETHYSPLGPSDDVPTEPVSVAVALADKLDTLTGFWAIDEKPTGSKDPFALRRAALGVIRLVLENEVGIELLSASVARLVSLNSYLWDSGVIYHSDDAEGPYIELAKHVPDWEQQLYQSEHPSAYEDEMWASAWRKIVLEGRSTDQAQNLLSFFHDRLKTYLRDRGIRHDIIDACIAMPGNDDLTLLVKRATALSETLKTDDGENLIQGFKRANNILTKEEEKDGVEYSYGADIKFAKDDAEKALFAALDTAEAAITPAMAAEDFGTAMTAMAQLRGPIDAFFTAVKINDDNETIRRNRLNLLHRIRAVCGGVADLTKVEG